MLRFVSPVILAVLLLLAGSSAGGAVAAQAEKVGKEFQVNSTTSGAQAAPAAASLKKDQFVVVWLSRGPGGDSEIYGQLFNRNGKKVGKEFRANTYRTDDQWDPDVAALKNGGFVVTWVSDGQDGSASGVYAQLFNKRGKKVGSEFRVNTFTADAQEMPVAAGLTKGGFVIVWGSFRQDGSFGGTYAQRYNRKGGKVGKEFRVNTVTSQSQWYPDVAATPDGGFVVAYSSVSDDHVDILFQRFNKRGKKVGTETQANTFRNTQTPKVVVLTDGSFVITWTSFSQKALAVYGGYGQIFSKTGKRQGPEFLFTSNGSGHQGTPRLAALPDGGFVAAWVDAITITDSATYDVRARRYDMMGEPAAEEFPAHADKAQGQRNPTSIALGNGRYLIFWDSFGRDGSNYGIFGRMFE